MIQLRFIERIRVEGERAGSVERILQYRSAPYAPWHDVPTYSLQEQARDAQARQEAADELGSYG